MKKKLLLALMALMSITYATASTVVPTTSTSGNDVWYMIRCNPRDASDRSRQWLSVDADGRMNYGRYTGTNNQWWKVVDMGTGLALVNKDGMYLNADQRGTTRMSAVSSVPTTPLRIVPASFYTVRHFDNSATIDVALQGVFIVDKTDATTVTESNQITYTTPANAFALTIYGPASGDILVTSQPNWGGGNTNQIVVFRAENEILTDIKASLLTAIDGAKTYYNSVSSGYNPGQFDPNTLEGLSLQIQGSQDLYDDPNATLIDCQASIIDINATINLVKSEIILPQLSNSTTDYWYYIQGTRPANTYMTAPAAGTGTQVKDLAVIPDDTQLWRLVTNGDGFALQNKASQEYIQTDFPTGTNLATQTDMPTKPLRFIASTEKTNNAIRFWIENTTSATEALRLHAGAGGNGWGVMNWTGGANDNCTWLFMGYDAAQRQFLVDQIAATNAYLATLKEGTKPGQLSTTVMNEIKKTIADAQAIVDNENSTFQEFNTWKTTLLDAQTNLSTKANLPIISVDDASSVYYTFSGTRPTTRSVLANINTTDTIQYQVLKAEDSELWRCVANGTGIALQNKATGKYLASDSIDGSDLITQTAMPTKPLKFIVSSQISSGAFRFLLEDDVTAGTDASFRLHAGLPVVMNWIGDAADNCTWSILENTESIINEFNPMLIAADALYTGSATVEGDGFGLYPAASRSTFSTILATAKSLNLTTLSVADLTSAYITFNNGYTVFKNSRNSDLNSIISTSANPKWFYITGSISGGAGYNKCLAKSGANVSASAKIADNTDQMWRFEINPTDGENTVLLINKTANEEVIISGQSTAATLGGGGTYLKIGIHGNGFATKFTYLNGTKEELLHFNGSPLVGWFDNNSTSSGWRIEPATSNTAVKDVTVAKLNIRSNNGIITVDGVDNFEVYSVMGQRMNVKAVLNKGIYVVKTAKVTQKYIVR